MKKLSAFLALFFACSSSFAQIPIVYYDFEDNSNRANAENAVEMSVNTPPAGASFIYNTSAAGGCNSIGCSNAQGKQGAGQEHGGSADGSSLTVGAWHQGVSDPTTGATSYYQVVVNTSGFTGISLMFDVKYGNGNAPDGMGVLISSNGSSWTFVGSNATPNGNAVPTKLANNSWSGTVANFNLSAASSAIANNNSTLYIRVYGYNASGAGGNGTYMALDNFTVLATGTTTGKVFTTLNENSYYTGITSGLTGSTVARGDFTATGAGTNVTINTTSGLRLASGRTFSVTSSGTVTLGSSGAISGAGIFSIASGANLVTSNAGGVPSSITTTGSNSYTAGANYTLNAATSTPFPTASFGSPNNVTINPGAGNTVTLNGNQTISGTLNISSGRLAVGSNTLTLNGTVSGMSSTNVLRGSATSVLVIGGSGSLGTLFLDQATPGTTNNFQTFTINRTSSGLVTLGNALAIGTGGLNLTNGSLADGGNVVTLAGNITGTGSHSGSGKISMTGSGSNISSVSLGNLELNNAGGFSLSGSPSIGGTLNFVAGRLSLGSNNLVFGIAAAVSGTLSSSSMIVANSTGQVRKLYTTNGSFLFPIGDNSNYTPITLDFTGGSYAVGAYAAVNVKTTKQPNNVNVSNYLNRYWSISTSGITSPVYNVSAATYATGDVVGTESSISAGLYAGSLPWTKFGAANTSTHTLSSASVSNTSFDFTGITTAAPSVASTASTSICNGGSVALNATGGAGDPSLTYTWAPAAGLSGTVGTSVTASPASTTTYTVTITDGNGFTGNATTTISVNPPPSITGNTSAICTGADNTLTGSPAGGTWASGDATRVTVNATTGVVHGELAGTATITYTASPGCVSTTEVTVLPVPAAITGSFGVCTGATTTLSHAVAGGTWNSSVTAHATINASGLVSGVLAGTSLISYTTPAGCVVTQEVTVYAVPSAITGSPSVCLGQTTSLSHAVGGGTWQSSNGIIASASGTGIVTGNTLGTANITYTVPVGCITITQVTVNPLPATIGGSLSVCEEATTNLTNTDGGGTWSIFPSSTATISSSGSVTGVLAGNATVVYTLPTGCSTTAVVTVLSTPAAISGTADVCVGATTSLTSLTAGGAWSSSQPSVGTISTGGVLAGIAGGNTNISYTMPNTCFRAVVATVNVLPSGISGDTEICVGASSALTTTSTGGTWGIDASGTLNMPVANGNVTGVADGTGTVTYTLPTGCYTTAMVTVDPLPAANTGTAEVCVNGVATLNNTTPGGTWSSAVATIATVNATTGNVAGVAGGNVDISYILPTGCAAITQVTVHSLPTGITGGNSVCMGTTLSLSGAPGGGTWGTSDAGIAGVDAGGNVVGSNAGTVNVTYTLSTGCYLTQLTTINALPAAIGGTDSVCVTSTITLTNADAGGFWNSPDATVTVNSSTGEVTGISAGTASISYMLLTGCMAARTVTVNALPAAITGPGELCKGATITLTNTDAGGTWTRSGNKISIDAGTGEVVGVNAGTSEVTYTLPTGCASLKTVTVNALPQQISLLNGLMPMSIVGLGFGMCDNGLVTVKSSTAGLSWSSSNTGVAAVNPSTGLLNALSVGTSTITGTDIHSCSVSTIVSVNPLPQPITGDIPVCENSTMILASASPGGTWSVSNPTVATVDGVSGLVSGIGFGTTVVTYEVPQPLGSVTNTCYVVDIIVVNPIPAPITGATSVCHGSSTDLDNATTGGVWSVSNSNATVDLDGILSGEAVGTTTVTYTGPNSCYVTRQLTINQLPAAISGGTTVCEMSSLSLSSAPEGGTWSSSTLSAAAIGSSTGVVTGIASGNTDITYSLPTGCVAVSSILVNPLPVVITGDAFACAGSGTTLANADAGGTWSSGATTIADIDASGVVSAIVAGSATISYTLPTGCVRTRTYTVNALPQPFTGGNAVCEGLSHTLGNALGGGTWVSSDASIADVSAAGLLSGIAAGTADVTYTLPTGCSRIEIATVNPAVPAIAGTAAVCVGLNATLTNSASGGVWISGSPSVATIDVLSGSLEGVAAGTSIVTYALPTGCINTTIATVHPLPAAITGTFAICAGQSGALHNSSASGLWSGGAPGIASITTGGIVSAIAAGTTSVTYTLPTGCLRSQEITVNALPANQAMTGGGNYCSGSAGVAVGLGGSEESTVYKLYRGTSIVGIVTGAGAGFDFGTYTATGTYSVRATNSGTGCVAGMTGTTTVSATAIVAPSVYVISAGGDTLCNGAPNVFTALPVNGGSTPSYVWFVNSTSIGTGATLTFAPANGDTIHVRLTSSEACAVPGVVSAQKRVNVIASQTPTVTVEQTASSCQGLPASFHATAAWGGAAPEFTWRRNSTDIGSGSNLTYVPADGDVITCRLASNYRCRTATTVNSTPLTLDVDSAYVPKVVIEASPSLNVRPGATVTLHAIVSDGGPAPVYEWRVNNVVIPGATTSAFTREYFYDDVVTSRVTGSGPCGLPSFNVVTVDVDPNAPASVAGVMGSGLAYSITPNPTHGELIVTGIASDDVLVVVTNMLGQVVYKTVFVPEQGVIKAGVSLPADLPSGNYLITVTTGEARQVSQFTLNR